MASDNSYKSILKGTSIFGGVQVFQILINLIRGKFVAVLLGPDGMGVASLFTTSSNTIQKFASLGLNLAIVREMAESSRDKEAAARFIGLCLRILAATSLLGALICIVFAYPLSLLTFETPDMAWQFVLLGIAVAFGIANTGILSILQGLHEVKRLSKASIVGGLTGLLVGVPLYWLYGTDGIVPAMVALSLAMFVFYCLSLRQAAVITPVKSFSKQHMPMIKQMIGLGMILMASDLIGTSATYCINLFISHIGSDYELGLYQAANSTTAQYSGMVFTAMAMDYFPRLTKAAHDNRLMLGIVNRQCEIVALIIAPAACLLIITAPIVIQVLFTEEYDSILPLMRWMGLGITLRALIMPMGYITFAKDNKKVFFGLEGVFGNLLTLVLSCIGYYFFGLIGLGYALVADNAVCLIVYYIVNRRLYGYRLTRESAGGMAMAVAITGACFVFSLLPELIWAYSIMAIIFTASMTWSVLRLRRKLKKPDSGEAA